MQAIVNTNEGRGAPCRRAVAEAGAAPCAGPSTCVGGGGPISAGAFPARHDEVKFDEWARDMRRAEILMKLMKCARWRRRRSLQCAGRCRDAAVKGAIWGGAREAGDCSQPQNNNRETAAETVLPSAKPAGVHPAGALSLLMLIGSTTSADCTAMQVSM